MITTETTLRQNGYSANRHGIVCSRGDRWSHERTGLLQIIVSDPTPAALALVDALIIEQEEPRALVGRDSRGAVLLFRVDPRSSINNKNVSFELPSGEGIEIIFGSDNLTVAVDKFTWVKNRSPLDVERDSLPPLREDHLKAAQSRALELGARHPSEFERQRSSEARLEKLRADIAASGLSAEAWAERERINAQHEVDLQLVERFAGQEPGAQDEMRAEIRAARYRVEQRAAEAATAATAA